MTQEDKKLLLADLCARLPYKVKICKGGIGKTVDNITIRPDYVEIVIKGTYAYCHFIHKDTGEWDKNDDLGQCKPYLRPMSSMTEEEKEELRQEQIKDEQLFADCIKNHPEMRGLIIPHFAADWCDKNMFDYLGLIEKGLAIETPEGMYNKNLQKMPYNYFPSEFSSYEDYVKYLKKKGFAIEVTEENNPYK